MASSSTDRAGTDLGQLMTEEELGEIVNSRAPASEAGQSRASAGKKPAYKLKSKGPALKRSKEASGKDPLEESTDGSITHPGKRYKVRDRDLEVVQRELAAIAPFVATREAENNASFDADVYPEWRRAPGWDAHFTTQPPNPKEARHIERKDVGLASLMHLDDETMKREGAALVTYQEMQAAINDNVNLSLLGQAENSSTHWKFLVKSNRETATLAYAQSHTEELLRSVPSDGGRYRLTPMQRIATALMLEPRAEETVEVALKKIHERGALGVRLRKAPNQPLNFIINNLSVASGKTWETIYATMSAVATPLAWRATSEAYMTKQMNGTQQAAGITELPPHGCQLELCRVVIALVPRPMIDHWVKTSMQLAETFGEHKWITWSGIAPIRRATKKQAGIKRTLPVAVEACTAGKCALFWVMEATTKSSAAATRTGPQFAIPYRIVDEGTGTKHIEPRNYDPESPYMKTIICNATLDQLQKRTVHQRQHPLRVALDGETLDLSRHRHAALMTMCCQPSWLRLAVANSLAPLMPQGVLKIAMKVRVASLAARLNNSDMIISSTDDLIKGLVMRGGASSMDPSERAAIEAKCRAILHRTDKSESIAGSLRNSIEQVKADRKTINETLSEARRGRIPGELPRAEDRQFEQDLERQDRALATMERLFTQLHEAIAGDPPPECPVTFDPIPAEHVCLCPSCAVILDHRMLQKLGWKCPCCRQKWNDGVVSAKQVADVVAKVPQPEEPAKDGDGDGAPSTNLAHDTAALVQSYKDASKDRCPSSLDAVVRSIEIALRYKPKGMRILLCCSVNGTARYTSDHARNEEENTAKTRDFILKALPQLTSALTIGRGPRALATYKANDDTNRLLIIDTSHGSTTMAGLDLQNTDLLIFDRLGSFPEDSTGTPRLVQSIGRIMRAQERTRGERRQDAKHYANTDQSVHSAKMVVFICHEKQSGSTGTSSSNPIPLDSWESEEEEMEEEEMEEEMEDLSELPVSESE